jgi:DNA replication and repair protein RecF
MIVKKINLQNLRTHKKAQFEFQNTTIIIGPNTAGKTNILESLYILSHGKSFRAENDRDVISEGRDFTRIEAEVESDGETKKLTVIFADRNGYLSKKFLINGVARRHMDFASEFYSVLFTPQDIEIITATPSLRRNYISSILTKANKQYRQALHVYEKALRQRNRMLHDMKIEKKIYKQSDFDYWDKILIENGNFITKKREEFAEFINESKKEMFDFNIVYDKSTISIERLFKYHFEERASGITLVGPQRDDFIFNFAKTNKKVSEFGSRGEERLTILQTRLLEIEYLKQETGILPILLLDDIFSELDDENISKVYNYISNQQTIITTTHKEFVPKQILKHKDLGIIEL